MTFLPTYDQNIFSDNPLLRVIYELDEPAKAADWEDIVNYDAVWYYRSHPTLQHLTITLQDYVDSHQTENEYPILHNFLTQV